MPESNAPTNRIVIELRWSRHTTLTISAILLVTAALLLTLRVSPSFGQGSPSASPASSSPTVLSYQGRVLLANGSPVNGTGYFKFAIIKSDDTVAYWTNDGTNVGGAPAMPAAPVALPVTNGQFSVLLGDISLTNMVSLAAGLFNGPDRALRVWFSATADSFEQLQPDVRIASVPFALNAETLGGLESAGYARAAHLHSGVDISDTVPAAKIDNLITRDSEVRTLAAASGFITQTIADARYARSAATLDQIALLKWYTAVSTTQDTFGVGSLPTAAAFDGTNIWVVNYFGESVTVLKARDGSLVMTQPVGSMPNGIAFDGHNMWVTNQGSNSVTVLKASDGSLVRTIPVDTGPQAIAFDGSNMWVGNYYSSTVSVLRVPDGTLVRTLTGVSFPVGLAFDGANMWVTASSGIHIFRASDGSLVRTLTEIYSPTGIAFDGTDMWVGSGGNSVDVLRITDGARIGRAYGFNGPRGMAFDGRNIWVANNGGASASVVRVSDRTVIATVPVGAYPNGIAFDGTYMWIPNAGDNTVSRR